MDNKILVTSPSMPTFDEYVEEIRKIWDRKWLTNMGPEHQTLQKELEDYLKVDYLDLLTNGHMAIELSLQALGLTGEVITTPFTFASTTHAIVRNRLTPVFCDINPDDYTIDATKIESLITDKTSAILPVHVYGNICDVEAIEKIAKKHHLKVIYDAAHTFGEEYKGKGIGSFGDVSCFSFHATKVYNTIEGGAVCFHDEGFGKKIYQLKDFGIKDQEVVDGVGANAKMNEFCAAMGICNLRHVDGEISKRSAVVAEYRRRLGNVPGLKLNPIQPNVKPNYAYFPVIFDQKVFGLNRDDVFEELKRQNIFTRKYFYPITNAFDCYKGVFDPSLTPIALSMSMNVLTLPLYADLALSDVDRICDAILGMKK
jgi:dTDP-4-amino-4,6-dideoxygalactose transaminase